MTASGHDIAVGPLDVAAARPPWSAVGSSVGASVGARAAWRRLRAAAAFALVATLTLGALAAGATAMGARPAAGFFVLVGLGAVGAHVFPARRVAIAVAIGILSLALLNPVFSLYFLILVAVLAACRRRPLPFAIALLSAAVILPKTAFARFYHQPGFWNWLNEPSLALALFASALWWRLRVDARRAAGAGSQASNSNSNSDGDGDGVLSFALIYFFPSHAAYPMAFSPKLLARADGVDVGGVLRLLGWFVAKAAALSVLRRFAPHGFLRGLGPDDADALGAPALWGIVLASYVETYLALAASADIPVLIARLYGWSLPNPFRAALLAWNPVELWRRWGIYNRYLLLRLVYFPLGGHHRHRLANVMLTFLASAWLLHSGWFGSKYWRVGPGGWRDEALYFLLQGVAVCACLAFWQVTGRASGQTNGQAGGQPPHAERELRVSAARIGATLATQAWSALAHVFVLAQGIGLASRAHLIARCLGL